VKEDVLFARLAVAEQECTRAEVQAALERVAQGESESLPAALLDMGYITPEAVEDLIMRIARGESEPSSPRRRAFEEEVEEEEEEDDPNKTRLPLLLQACFECGRSIEEEELEAGHAFIFFGEMYCADCLSNTQRLFRLQDARHARAKRKYKLDPPPPPAEPDLPAVEEEAETPPLPTGPVGKKKKSSRREPAVRSEELPPPLPKAASVDELPEEEVAEIGKLIAKGKRDLARSKLGRIMKCSSTEAEAALKKLEEEVLRVGTGSRGIFGFARNIARSSSFKGHVRRERWEKVIEEGEAWLLEEPQNVDVLTSVGMAYMEEGKAERAERTLRRAPGGPGRSPVRRREVGRGSCPVRRTPFRGRGRRSRPSRRGSVLDRVREYGRSTRGSREPHRRGAR
jgi:hypothetical protein